MDKDIEKACYTFRSYIRMLRKGINDTCYYFKNESIPMNVYIEVFPKIDETLYQLFSANNLVPNEKIEAMEKFYQNVFPPLDPQEVVAKIEPLILEVHTTIQQRMGEVDMTKLDEKKKASYDNLRKQLDSLAKPFDVEEIIDVPQITRQISNLFVPPITVEVSDIAETCEKYIAVYQISKSIKSLKEFKVPPKMTEEQAEIKKLNDTIKKLNETIKEQKEQISKLQQEKMGFKRENIQMKKENEVYKQQNEDLIKRNNQMNSRLTDQPKMKTALENIAAIILAPPKETESK